MTNTLISVPKTTRSRDSESSTPQGAIGSGVARLDSTKPAHTRNDRAMLRDGGCPWAGCLASVRERASCVAGAGARRACQAGNQRDAEHVPEPREGD